MSNPQEDTNLYFGEDIVTDGLQERRQTKAQLASKKAGDERKALIAKYSDRLKDLDLCFDMEAAVLFEEKTKTSLTDALTEIKFSRLGDLLWAGLIGSQENPKSFKREDALRLVRRIPMMVIVSWITEQILTDMPEEFTNADEESDSEAGGFLSSDS